MNTIAPVRADGNPDIGSVVRESRRRQGLPERVEDREALARIGRWVYGCPCGCETVRGQCQNAEPWSLREPERPPVTDADALVHATLTVQQLAAVGRRGQAT